MKQLVCYFLLLPGILFAQEQKDRIEIEGGFVGTQNMEIHGYNQSNATSNWTKSGPIFRLEYWRLNKEGWNYGLAYQPLSLKYEDKLKSNLNYKGKVFQSGDTAVLDYQFPTLRLSANTSVFKGDDLSEMRLGGSGVIRYARVALTSSSQSITDTNLIVIPLINIEYQKPINDEYSFYTRSDFLPGIDGNIFLDGLYDIFAGVRKKLQHDTSVDVGVRLFFGGYDPKKADDYANRIFFKAVVVKYSF